MFDLESKSFQSYDHIAEIEHTIRERLYSASSKQQQKKANNLFNNY